MHLIIRERSRVQGNQNNAGSWEISCCSEKLREFYVESQTRKEKDGGKEGGTTLSIKMSEGNREVRGFRAI